MKPTVILNDNFSRQHNANAAKSPEDTTTLAGDVTTFDLDVTYLGNGCFDLPVGAKAEPGSDTDEWVLTLASGNVYHLVTNE